MINFSDLTRYLHPDRHLTFLILLNISCRIKICFAVFSEEILYSKYMCILMDQIMKYLTNHQKKSILDENKSFTFYDCKIWRQKYCATNSERYFEKIRRKISYTIMENVDFSNSFDHRGRNLLDNDNESIKRWQSIWNISMIKKIYERHIIHQISEKYCRK